MMPEIVVHLYRDLPMVIEYPLEVDELTMLEFATQARAWADGSAVLMAQGFSVIVCDHRQIDTLVELV